MPRDDRPSGASVLAAAAAVILMLAAVAVLVGWLFVHAGVLVWR